MRKKNCAFFFDTLFWFVVYLLPVIAYLVFLSVDTSISFLQFFTNNFLAISNDNIFVTVILSIFGENGILPLFSSSSYAIVNFLAYFVTCYFIHFCVDILMLLPRMLMNFMDKFGGGC